MSAGNSISVNPELNKFKFLTPREVSEITGFALQTLANHRLNRRGIPYSKIGGGESGGTIRYALADVLKSKGKLG